MNEIVIFAPVVDPWFIFVGKACDKIGVNFRLITLAPDVVIVMEMRKTAGNGLKKMMQYYALRS